METPLADRIAQYATQLKFDELSHEVVHEVKRRVIDSIGCAMGAWNADPCRIARQIALKISANPGATLWGTSHRTSPDWAAFANGCLVRYLDYNDTYLSREPAHPSDNIPAAIAAAESCGSTGRELIAAIVIAYEIQCRLADAASLRSIGWDHVTYGTFSTAAAAGRLMQLDPPQLAHALGIAGVTSAALRQTRVGELSHWKGCAFANAARHGVFSAMLAREGMTGPAPIFEGSKGFEKLVSGRLEIKGPFAAGAKSPAVPGGESCMILRTSIKCWPVEYHAQSAVEAALRLRQEIYPLPGTPGRGQGEGPSSQAKDSQTRPHARPSPQPSPRITGAREIEEAIDSILIQSHDAAVDIIGSEPEKWRPASRETADHSLPYIVATALIDAQITKRQFDPDHLGDKHLLDLVSRVRVERHAELSNLYPGAVGNIITVTLRDGRQLTQRVDHPCGHANNPMSDAAVENKFHTLADPVLGPDRANRIAEWVWNLEQHESLSELLDLMQLP